MAKWTVSIRTLIDNNFDFKMTSYPIFDESYRNTLNQKILYHYYENEIGFETPALFRFYLNQKLDEIMPYYNNLYKAQMKLLNEDVLYNNVNLTETSNTKNNEATNKTNDITTKNTQTGSGTSSDTTTGSSTDNTKGTSSETTTGKQVYLDTPQGNTYKGSIDDTNYATNVTFNNGTDNISNETTNTISNTSSNTGNTTSSLTDDGSTNSIENGTLNSTSDYLRTIVGNNGSKYNIDLLDDIRNNLMNIDMMIINDLNELFMGLL